MVYGINNVQGLNATSFERTNSNVNFGQTKPMEADTYKGKGLLMLAGVAGAVIFRKNIAGFFQKVFPNASKFVAQNFAKLTNAVKKFCANNKFAGKVADLAKKGINYAKGFYNKIVSFFKPQAATVKEAVKPMTDVVDDAVKVVSNKMKAVVTPDVAKVATAPPAAVTNTVIPKV